MTKTSTTAAAQIAKVTTRTIRRWIAAGKVIATKVARRWVIDAASLRAHVARREDTTTEPVHVIAYRINQIGHAKAFVQRCGTLRIVARTCALAKIELGRAIDSLGLREEAAGIDRFQVRFAGTEKVLTYPMATESAPLRRGLDIQTGAYIEKQCDCEGC